ncbi:hypothetical protein CERSUDRAFT_74339 [Gelatoporia subvermispora B]|uniref:DUF6534 domain-containing protein n=1 Tax=Ceriporiopsis subvermispora (strain B) TaxID=914234 RepID=M2QH24_CERS8|nr:hypothetical protein CERSUDRAFT_74339 [Gelatoporia subvermispora B]
MASPIDVKSTYGAYMLGVVISARAQHSLYGITVAQTHTYYSQSNRDAVSLNTLHEVLLVLTIYDYLIGDYGNPLAIAHITGSYWAALVMSGIIEFIVKGGEELALGRAHRELANHIHLGLFTQSGTAGVIALIGFERTQPSYTTGAVLNDMFYWTVAVGVSGDVLLATAQATILWRWQTGFKSIVDITELIVVGLLARVTVSRIHRIVQFALFRNTESLIYVAVYHQLPGMYINALLATLNAREELRELMYGTCEQMAITPWELPDFQDAEMYAVAQNANEGVLPTILNSIPAI